MLVDGSYVVCCLAVWLASCLFVCSRGCWFVCLLVCVDGSVWFWFACGLVGCLLYCLIVNCLSVRFSECVFDNCVLVVFVGWSVACSLA